MSFLPTFSNVTLTLYIDVHFLINNDVAMYVSAKCSCNCFLAVALTTELADFLVANPSTRLGLVTKYQARSRDRVPG